MKIERETVLFQSDLMITAIGRTQAEEVYFSGFSNHLFKISSAGQVSSMKTVKKFKSITTFLISETEFSKILYLGCSDSVIYIKNLDFPENRLEKEELKGHESAVLCLTFDKRRKTLFSGSSDTTVRIWDTEKLRNIAILTYNKESILSLSLYDLNDDPICLVGSASNTLSTIRSEGSIFSYEFFTINDSDEVSCVTFIKSIENSLVAGLLSGNIEIWSFDQYKLQDLKGHQDRVTALASMTMTGKEIIISGGRDFKIMLWEVNGQVLLEISSHQHIVTSLAANPDNQALVSGSWDGTVRSFKLKSDFD